MQTNAARAMSFINRRFGVTLGRLDRIPTLNDITPVTDIDSLALAHRSLRAVATVNGTGPFAESTVPATERWHLQGAMFHPGGSLVGDFHLFFSRAEEGYSGTYRPIWLSDTISDMASARYSDQGLVLFPGDKAGVSLTAYTSGGVGSEVHLVYLIEECSTS